MLKITREIKDDTIIILKLEGRVSSPWLFILKEILSGSVRDTKKQIILDFLGVTYISHEGVKLINEFKGSGIGKQNCSLFIEYMFRNGVKNICNCSQESSESGEILVEEVYDGKI
ncbi:MAG: hypothetical protein HY350_02585 [Candidatus Omnitrophica bacterium]|nr:hypothetical protein [Candidatus Omnitrophota bacterium]